MGTVRDVLRTSGNTPCNRQPFNRCANKGAKTTTIFFRKFVDMSNMSLMSEFLKLLTMLIMSRWLIIFHSKFTGDAGTYSKGSLSLGVILFMIPCTDSMKYWLKSWAEAKPPSVGLGHALLLLITFHAALHGLAEPATKSAVA